MESDWMNSVMCQLSVSVRTLEPGRVAIMVQKWVKNSATIRMVEITKKITAMVFNPLQCADEGV